MLITAAREPKPLGRGRARWGKRIPPLHKPISRERIFPLSRIDATGDGRLRCAEWTGLIALATLRTHPPEKGLACGRCGRILAFQQLKPAPRRGGVDYWRDDCQDASGVKRRHPGVSTDIATIKFIVATMCTVESPLLPGTTIKLFSESNNEIIFGSNYNNAHQ